MVDYGSGVVVVVTASLTQVGRGHVVINIDIGGGWSCHRRRRWGGGGDRVDDDSGGVLVVAMS